MEKRKAKRYTRRQVRRNRIIAFCCLVALCILLIFLIVQGIKGLLGGDEENTGSSSTVVSQSAKSSQSSKDADSSSQPSSDASSASSSEDSSQQTDSSRSSGDSSGSSKAPGSSSAGPVDSNDPYYEASMPLLVNPDNLMPEDYKPTVVSVGGNYKLETRAAAAWKKMQAAASNDGVSLWIISAYRTLERQTELYNEKVEEYKALGYSEADAKAEAGKWVAVPGTSEHCLGYAADLCSLEESFENSNQFAWLQKHFAQYGFILRYPKDKVDITKISYEPWHYRYVGSNHAQIIMSEGLCLEEYLEQYA